MRAVSLHCAADQLSDDVLLEAQANDIPVLCYTVNGKKRQNQYLIVASVPYLPIDLISLSPKQVLTKACI
jgi:hypothetical protein